MNIGIKNKLNEFLFLFLSISLIKANINEKKIINNELDNNEVVYFNNTNNISNYEEIKIDNGTKIIIIPKISDNTYKYLTFEVIPYYGKINVSCENKYNNTTIIENYKSYFYTYKKENMKDVKLLITCKEGLKMDIKCQCLIKVNIYHDNNFINMNNEKINILPLFKYISTNNTHKYYFKGDNNIHLNIIIYSGKIRPNIESNNKSIFPVFEYKNSKLYILQKNKNWTISIEGLEDSFYSIYDYNNVFISNNSLLIGSNYLLKDPPIINIFDYFYLYNQEEILYYLSFFPNNCLIDVDVIDPTFIEIKNNKNMIKKIEKWFLSIYY